MPTTLTRYTLTFTPAQLADLRLRFPEAVSDKAAIYTALGFDQPKAGGVRPARGKDRTQRKRRGRKPRPPATDNQSTARLDSETAPENKQ